VYPFGQDFTYSFYPLIDSEQAKDIPGDAPAIYVYGETKPSRDQARAGTGGPIQTISEWTAIDDGFRFPVTAILDPDPSGAELRRTFWIAVNFRLKAGGQLQTVLAPLVLERVRAHNKTAIVTVADISSEWSHATDYATTEQIQRYIEDGLGKVKSKLKERGFEWAGVNRADRLAAAIRYWAVMRINLRERKTTGDTFDENVKLFYSWYTQELESLQFAYDGDGDGEHEQKEETVKPTYAVILR
jgi:hypothetical protein